jgi:molecular chaperone HtpG
MEFPEFLSTLIESDHQVSAIVNGALSKFAPWVGNSQMPLFPEYTDHSITHIEDVIRTAVDLATDLARDLISVKDAAILVLAICLHDCAMHLTEDGFLSLVRVNSPWHPITAFGAQPWSVLWDEFIAEARRFDGRKLTALFGDTDPIRRPPEKVTDLSKRDRLLMGEFIRRHHARLAHEIALHGIPGTDGVPVPLIDVASELGQWMADMAGVTARSHGIPLRAAVEYISAKYHVRDFNTVHAVFLMVLVRIADYLQIQAKRAPTEILEVRKLASPVSVGEWKVHASIRNITSAGDDPEAIFIDAQPTEIQSFLRVREWLTGIQDELDLSWAVLGEVFGRYRQEKLDQLGLKLRRIHSNIDNVEEFAKTVSYVPAKISFETANPDLLKLLVGPLYGEDPGIGLRELIQNAIDAVRELDELRNHRPELRNVPTRKQDFDVTILLECDEEALPQTLTVTDRGIGMDLDVVQNYFLKAGASFRRSDAWRRRFEDAAGRSTVLRSGRFGVGALAAFLIGDAVEVTTRHVESPASRGIKFSASLDDPSLSLSWTTCPVGTLVRINIPDDKREQVQRAFRTKEFVQYSSRKLSFDDGFGQYFASEPSVRRSIKIPNQAEIVVESMATVPTDKSSIVFPWRCFETTDFKVYWTYSSIPELEHRHDFPQLMCNGIVVEPARRSRYPWGRQQNLFDYDFLDNPSLLVYDKDGKLPLNLQRTKLTSRNVGFSDELLVSITDDLIVYALLTGIESPRLDARNLRWLRGGEYAGFGSYPYGARPGASHRWFLTNRGFGLLDPKLILQDQPATIVIGYTTAFVPEMASTILTTAEANNCSVSDMRLVWCDGLDTSQINNRKFLARSLLEWGDGKFLALPYPIKTILLNARRVFIKDSLTSSLLGDPNLGRDLRRILAEAKAEATYDGWRVVPIGKCPPAPISVLDNTSLRALEGVDAIAECYVSEHISTQSLLASRWMEMLGSAIIPYDKHAREENFRLAFQKLSSYLALWRTELSRVEEKIENGETDT